ncbi:LuxR C-terminal-related transcriptional regulator [Nevskia ramosa]|uniref:LuxR C-terminal-related transcriptional regulator n=1 Tax=Nevskia ramosa TaxID=64002 RepID=UPI0003B4D61A|nr:LuxR C-terminal-related transcriptional regulator [Nevskia ramosa]
MIPGAQAAANAEAEVYSHKLFAPTSYTGAIQRKEVLQRALRSSTARVVFLQAPAGHGKTTALQQLKSLCESEGCRTGWLSFDDADNDTRRFSVHLQAVVASLIGDDAMDAPPAGDEDFAGPKLRTRTDWIVDRLLKIGAPVAIFLDEFQVLTNKSLLAFFRELFEHVPANVRIFVGSRSVPDIGMAKLLVNNQTTLLRADDLRFSRSEVEQFFASSGAIEISREEVESVYLHTEGWPAAIQLFRLSLANPDVRRTLADFGASRPRELAEYLTDSVLSLQPPDDQEFLLRTSLLGRMCAPLCDEVTGRSRSQDTLLRLERSGLFIRSLDAELRWFKYHALFSTFLAEQLRSETPEIAYEVHQRAAAWHYRNGNYEEAVHHALEYGDAELAADALNIWASNLVSRAHLMTVERWFSRLPLEVTLSRRELVVKVAYALTFLRRYSEMRKIELVLERDADLPPVATGCHCGIVLSMAAMSRNEVAKAFAILENVDVRNREMVGFGAFEYGAAANLLAYQAITCGDFERGRELIAIARDHNERSQATFSGGYTVAIDSMGYLLRGQIDEAQIRLRTGMAEHQPELDKSFASAAIASCYAIVLYEANELDGLEAMAGAHLQAIADSTLPDWMLTAYLAVARGHDARGRSNKCSEVLDEAEAICRANGWTRLVSTLNWERVRRSLLTGDAVRANKIAASIRADKLPQPEGWLPFAEEIEGEILGRIRLAIHGGDLAQATELISAEMADASGRAYRLIKLHLLEATLQHRKGQRNASHRSLRKALQLAEPGGYVRVMLDEGNDVINLLQEEYSALQASVGGGETRLGPSRVYLELLLNAAGRSLSTSSASGQRPLEALTDREKEILVFLANGVSNKEMAGRIFVSENTIKFHLKNIYSKLAVSSRVQAITAGRQLGLIA